MTLTAIEVDAYPESRVNNSQPHGIGRVVALDGLFAWNNLGRNAVFAGEEFRPRAVFDDSVFVADEPSQYDLDVHAILDVPNAGIVLTLNHLGMLRAFSADALRRPGLLRRVVPLWTRTFAPDVERTVVLDDRIVGSRPREDGGPGLLVSERLSTKDGPGDLETRVQLEMCGMVTALAAFRDSAAECVTIGGKGRISLAPAAFDGVGPLRWTVEVDFEPMVLLWDGALVWGAGSECAATAVDDHDWEALHRGGFVALDPTDGRVVVCGRFPEDLAWGNGGVALALVPGALCGIGRHGELYLFDARDGTHLMTTQALADAPLGIAHAAAVGDWMLYGFNRGGYRLHATRVGAIPGARS
ncbi:MAG: hypothetical protein JWM72_1319 [Actinomycetia bacterium]|nr:hypothetical protein [Actinomycetes bacterium]